MLLKFKKDKKLFIGKENKFRILDQNQRKVFKQYFFPLYGGALISKTPRLNYVTEKHLNQIYLLDPFFVFLNIKKGLYLIFDVLSKNGNILLATNELVIRRYLKQFIKGIPFVKKNIQFSVRRWTPGALSNFKNVRQFVLPDVVVALAADFDESVLIEASVVTKPSISLVEGRFSTILSDYPVFFSGALISPGKVFIKIIVDYLFMVKKKNLY